MYVLVLFCLFFRLQRLMNTKETLEFDSHKCPFASDVANIASNSVLNVYAVLCCISHYFDIPFINECKL